MTAPDTTREGLAKVIEDVAVRVLSEHVGRVNFAEVKCTCAAAFDRWAAHRAHVAQALAAALHDHLTAALAAEREAVLGEVERDIEAEMNSLDADRRFSFATGCYRALRIVRNLRAGGGVVSGRELLCWCGHNLHYHSSNGCHAGAMAECPCTDSLDTVLVDLLRRAREAGAREALLEAARELPGSDGIRTHGDAADWLRARADGLAGGGE